MTATYELHYFKFHGKGLIPRMVLALGGFTWSIKLVKFVLAEFGAIYRYLGRKVGIMGQTEHEMALVEQFCSSWEELYEVLFPLVGGWKHLLSPEQYEKSLRQELYEVIKPIVMKHEEALAKNKTGFYVGDKMTVADFHAAVSMPLLNHGGDLFTKEEMPNLFSLHDKVMAIEVLKSEYDRYLLN
ncbi:hypothetical protein INT43_000380 [Umbelopsis isabellina]|uniref:glutathione transferase n=1 Tax=Mortierella isabellina TaxID=91625 RepID=A0A8H7Q4E0_MORIS|nr:hypothetical protein INT43_000380 [Umbelopsis isabellina]